MTTKTSPTHMMTVEELMVSITNPNANDTQYHIEIRKDDGYWFIDAVEDGWERGNMLTFSNYDTDLRYALVVLFNQMQEAEAWS